MLIFLPYISNNTHSIFNALAPRGLVIQAGEASAADSGQCHVMLQRGHSNLSLQCPSGFAAVSDPRPGITWRPSWEL